MENFTNQNIAALLAVIYKRLEEIENKIDGGKGLSSTLEKCYEKLIKEAKNAFIS